MRILIVTPAPPRSRKGNRVTALRWLRIFNKLGHRVTVAEQYDRQRCDVMIALHARRSARAVRAFDDAQPDKPLILTLTGTDLYRDIHRNRTAMTSLELADRLTLLQPHGIGTLPAKLRHKARVIYQSVPAPKRIPAPLKSVFEVCVSGHLRPVKDPFRAAMAARRLPDSSRIRIIHLGGALSSDMERRAVAEMEVNPRYQWLGELSRGKALQRLARSRLLVLTSKLEGGANVISEAVVASVPVVSSHISGSIGLLGEDYPGFFEVGDTAGLAEMLHRAETDRAFYDTLKAHCDRLKPLFDPNREMKSWQELLSEFES